MAESERLKLAKAISKMILQKYRNEILFVGVYGSVARFPPKIFAKRFHRTYRNLQNVGKVKTHASKRIWANA